MRWPVQRPMRRLQIDFVELSPWRLPVAVGQRRILLVCWLLAVLAGAGLLWQWQQLEQDLEATLQDIARARHEIAVRTPPPAPPLTLSEPEVQAINKVIAQLNTPWPAILDGFERVGSVSGKPIALLQIEPDSHRHLVKGVAEARDHQQMLDYLALLGASAPFVTALVSKHEENDKDPNRPIRFTFEAFLADYSPALINAAAGERNAE